MEKIDQKNLNLLAEQIASEIITKDEDLITKGISQKIDWKDGWESTISRVAINAVKVSTTLSVKTILSFLSEMGILNILQDEAGPKLTVVQRLDVPESPEQESPK